MKKFNKKEIGFAVDIDSSYVDDNGTRKIHNSHKIWKSMIYRCYNKNCSAYKTYGKIGVTICDEWKLYSNFKKWYDENYIEGFHIDKDILCEKLGVYPKIYSESTCIFVSKSENSSESVKRTNKKYKMAFKGWYFYEKNPTRRRYFVQVCKNNNENFKDFHEDLVQADKNDPSKKYVYTKIKDKETRRFCNDKIAPNKIYALDHYNKIVRNDVFLKKCMNEKINYKDFVKQSPIEKVYKNYYIHISIIEEEILRANKCGVCINWI